MKHYLITDPAYYGSTPEALEAALDVIYSHTLPDFALFRDKQTSRYRDLAQTFVAVSRSYAIPSVLLHGDYALACELKADGVQPNSQSLKGLVGLASDNSGGGRAARRASCVARLGRSRAGLS